MKWYKKPLNSDSFSNFSVGDPNRALNDREVREAIKVLKEKRVPQIAKLMRPGKGGKWITKTMQQLGVNCRYLGLVRQNLSDENLQNECLTEMCARVLSGELKHNLRETAKKKGLSRKFLFFDLTSQFYNSILNNKSFENQLDSFWSNKKGIKSKLKAKFEEALFEGEKFDNFDLRQKVDIVKVILRIEQKVGVQMKQETREKIENLGREKIEGFSFSVFDFDSMKANSKGLGMISFAIAESMKKQAELKPMKEKIQTLKQAGEIIELTGLGNLSERLWWLKLCLEVTKLEIDLSNEKTREKEANGRKEAKKSVIEKLDNLSKEVEHFLLFCEVTEEEVPRGVKLVESEILNQRAMLVEEGEEWEKKLGVSMECWKTLQKCGKFEEQPDKIFFQEIEKSSLEMICKSLRRLVWQLEAKFANKKVEEEVLELLKEECVIDFIEENEKKRKKERENDGGLLRAVLVLGMKNKELKKAREVLKRVIFSQEEIFVEDLFHKKARDESVGELVQFLSQDPQQQGEQEQGGGLKSVNLRGMNLVSAEKIDLLLQFLQKGGKGIEKVKLGSANKYKSEEELSKIFSTVKESVKSLEIEWIVTKRVDFLKELKNLEELEIRHSPHIEESSLVKTLEGMKELKKLSVEDCSSITNNFFNSIKKREKIECLSVKGCQEFDDESLKIVVKKFPNLQILDISGCEKISSKALKKVCDLEHLVILNARGCKGLTDKTKLDDMEKLELIDFSETNISNSLLFSLSECKLKGVNLENTHVTEKGLLPIFDGHWERAERVLVRGCNLNDKIVKSLVKEASNLKELSLSKIDKTMLEQVGCTSLERLSVKNLKMSERTVEKFFKGVKKLKELDISNSNIDKKQLDIIVRECKEIEKLSIGSKLESISSLSGLKRLRELSLENSSISTEKFDELFVNHELKLEKFTGCISDQRTTIDIFPSLSKSSGFYLRSLYLPFYISVASRKDNTLVTPNLEELWWPSNQSNLSKVVELSKLRKITFPYIQINNYDMVCEHSILYFPIFSSTKKSKKIGIREY